MAKKLSKQNITAGMPSNPAHLLQIIDAFTGDNEYDILISGSLLVNGKIILQNIPISSTGNLLGIDSEGNISSVNPSLSYVNTDQASLFAKKEDLSNLITKDYLNNFWENTSSSLDNSFTKKEDLKNLVVKEELPKISLLHNNNLISSNLTKLNFIGKDLLIDHSFQETKITFPKNDIKSIDFEGNETQDVISILEKNNLVVYVPLYIYLKITDPEKNKFTLINKNGDVFVKFESRQTKGKWIFASAISTTNEISGDPQDIFLGKGYSKQVKGTLYYFEIPLT